MSIFSAIQSRFASMTAAASEVTNRVSVGNHGVQPLRMPSQAAPSDVIMPLTRPRLVTFERRVTEPGVGPQNPSPEVERPEKQISKVVKEQKGEERLTPRRPNPRFLPEHIQQGQEVSPVDQSVRTGPVATVSPRPAFLDQRDMSGVDQANRVSIDRSDRTIIDGEDLARHRAPIIIRFDRKASMDRELPKRSPEIDR